ncbi:MAG: DUF2789 domain-containing protein, partial [Pseudomonadales bacterium]|nr:DUF2789 domain-containing protein [Pseudomonadales bacterium]
LFKQLGLPDDDVAIEQFICKNKLSSNIHLADAVFWTASQSIFLREAITRDSDWAEVVDHLDALLRAD